MTAAARIAGIAIAAPGIEDWSEARGVLTGETDWSPGPMTPPPLSLLKPNERRRISPFMRLSLGVAAAAAADAGRDPASLDCVFGSAAGDGSVSHGILHALRMPGKPVSPTHFHNSVHNATAGYWSIGTGNHEASTSISAGDGTVGAALMKALMTVSVSERPVLLTVAEYPLLAPLDASRPIAHPFAVSLVLIPKSDGPGPTVALQGMGTGPATPPSRIGLNALWLSSPAARALPLLERLVTPGAVTLEAGDGAFLTVEVVS